MGLERDTVHGQTRLDEDETDGLLIPSISARRELDEFEQQNIESAIQWTLTARIRKDELLTEAFIKRVHRKMYSEVWRWAGEFRKTNKNIGVDWRDVAIELKKLLGDCKYWVAHGTYAPDEIAIRFKHRLVAIHCFPNGNGRHSRLMADLIALKILNRPIFTWGSKEITKGTEREVYLAALKFADANDISRLVDFARR